MNCRECEELIAVAIYDEMDEDTRRRFQSHLDACPECAQTYSEMRSTLRAMDERERPDPGQAYWDGYWNRLTARMEREEERKRRRGWLGRLLPTLPDPALRWAQRGVLAAVLIVFGAVVGRMVLPGPETAPPETKVATTSPKGREGGTGRTEQEVRTASAEACARQYIEDSQVLLLALVNADVEAEGDYQVDWSTEKQRSRELVDQAASLKGDLTNPKQRRLRELVTELELILLQISNLETAGDLEAVDLIRSSVNDKDIMLKINLQKMRGGEIAEPGPGECDA